MTRKAAINIILVLLIVILGVVGYKLSPLMHPSASVMLPAAKCDPGAQDCTAALPDGGHIELSFNPRPIHPLEAFKADVAVRGTTVVSAELDFDGSTMKMGYYRPKLTESNGRYSAEVILPVCVTGTMEWAATVLLTTPDGTIAVPFHFDVARR